MAQRGNIFRCGRILLVTGVKEKKEGKVHDSALFLSPRWRELNPELFFWPPFLRIHLFCVTYPGGIVQVFPSSLSCVLFFGAAAIFIMDYTFIVFTKAFDFLFLTKDSYWKLESVDIWRDFPKWKDRMHCASMSTIGVNFWTNRVDGQTN